MNGTVLTAVLCLAFATAADLVPPGRKRVRHELVVESAPTLEGKKLVAAPCRGIGGVHDVVVGDPFRFSQKYGSRLFLVPADLDEPWSPRWVDRFPASGTFTEVWSAPLGTPLDRVETAVAVSTADAGRTLRVEILSEARFDRFGNRIDEGLTLLLLAAISVAGLLWLARLAAQRRIPAAGTRA